MSELPLQIQRLAKQYKPIQQGGLTLYPILVREFEEFSIAQPALEVLHQSLPVALIRMPLLAALYAMDYDAVVSGQTATGLFARARLLLALSLRLGDGLEANQRVELMKVVVDRNDPRSLICLRFTDSNGEELAITPPQFKNLREIIAAQNGVDMLDESANPDIVKAQKLMQEGNVQLDVTVDALVSAVSALSGTDEADIYEWPILKLKKRSDAYLRILDYLVCGIGETNGATWKNGNPTPHPFFKKIQNGGFATPMDTGKSNVPAGVQQIVAQTQNL